MNEKEKKVAVEAEDDGKDIPEKESDAELYEEMLDKKIDLQTFADELGKEHAKSKGLNIFGKKKKSGESSEKIEQLNDQLSEKDEKIKELENSLKSMVAENRNQKTRIENEYRSRIKFAMEDFFRDFVTVKDDFDKAMEFIPKEVSENKDPFIEGVKNLHKKMENVMSSHGLKAYSGLGEKFDHEIHQAMSIMDVEGKEKNEVVAEYVKGYKYYERVLRAAMVVVATGNAPSPVVEQDDEIFEPESVEETIDENAEENIEEGNIEKNETE
jgi:molecular chaperone GrpE